MRWIHVGAGAIGLIAGFVALYAAKGGRVHRRVGMVFVYAMLTMCAFGVILALRNVWREVNVPAGLTTAYLIITSLTTVRPVAKGGRGLAIGAMVFALVCGTTMLTFGLEAVANGGTRNGIPAFPFLLFGVTALLGGAGDLRVLQRGALTGTRRLARHLWRMCFALFIASMSFFIGQADVFPKPIRIMPLLALPVVAVLVTMLYWLWRVRIRRSVRGIIGLGAAEASLRAGTPAPGT